MSFTFNKPKRGINLKSSRFLEEDDDERDELKCKPAVSTSVCPSADPPTDDKHTRTLDSKSAIVFEEEGETFQIQKPQDSIKVTERLKKQVALEKISKPKGQRRKKLGGVLELSDHFQEGAILTGDDAEEAESSIPTSKSTGNGHKSAETIQQLLQSGSVPDAKVIHLIRQKRQLLRETGVADAIDTIRQDGKADVKPASRLVREDDENDRSDASDQEDSKKEHWRLPMSVSKRYEDERRRLRDEFLEAEQGSGEEDELANDWEQQQLLKGVKTAVGEAKIANTTLIKSSAGLGSFAPAMYEAGGEKSALFYSTYSAVQMGDYSTPSSQVSRPPPPVLSRPNVSIDSSNKVTVAQIRAQLGQYLKETNESLEKHQSDIQRIAVSIEGYEKDILEVDGKAESLDEQYKYFQQLTAYTTDFIDCYNANFATISGFEEKLITAHRQRTERLLKRRRQDVIDQSLEVASSKGQQSKIDSDMQMRVTERNNRRSRRKWRRQEQNIRNHNDGWSTDDEESTSDNIRIGTDKDAVRKLTSDFLAEIRDEFVRIDLITARFSEWRETFPESYRDAYGGLCLPKLLVPIVRLHVIEWNPLSSSPDALFEHSWFRSLAAYCLLAPEHPPAATSLQEQKRSLESEISGDELSILPHLVDKPRPPTIHRLPILQKNLKNLANSILLFSEFAAKVWDPLSLEQTKTLATTLEQLSSTFPSLNSSSETLRQLMTSIVARFSDVIEHDIFIPMLPKAALADRSSSQAQFHFRQLWTGVKLFVALSRFSTLLSPETLQELMLARLLNRYIVIGLSQLSVVTPEMIELYTKLILAVPAIWFSVSNQESGTSLPALPSVGDKLRSFANLVCTAVINFSKSPECDSAGAVELSTMVCEFFVSINANDLAVKVISELGGSSQ